MQGSFSNSQAGVLACLSYLPLALAHIHVDQLGPLDRQEVDGALGGDSLGQQRLARACRVVRVVERGKGSR